MIRSGILKSLIALSLLVLLAGGAVSCAGGRRAAPVNPDGADNPRSSNPGLWLALLFREHISAVDGDRCPSIPTCSAYSAEAFRRYGFFKGWLMTVDRLIHEADEGDYSELVYRDGKVRILDPLESNDIWPDCEKIDEKKD